MTVPQFKKWLESKIQYLRGLDEFENPDDGPYGLELLEEAYQIAIDLGLPECAKACKPPVTIGLLACLEAIPEPKEKRVYNEEEAAQRLGVSRRTVGRLIDAGELECNRIRGRKTITEEQIQAYLELADSESLFG